MTNKERDMQRWVIEIQVSDMWVSDGIDLAAHGGRQAQDMVERAYPHLRSNEIRTRVLDAPTADDVARLQGYASAADREEREKSRRVL